MLIYKKLLKLLTRCLWLFIKTAYGEFIQNISTLVVFGEKQTAFYYLAYMRLTLAFWELLIYAACLILIILHLNPQITVSYARHSNTPYLRLPELRGVWDCAYLNNFYFLTKVLIRLQLHQNRIQCFHLLKLLTRGKPHEVHIWVWPRKGLKTVTGISPRVTQKGKTSSVYTFIS